MKKWKGAELQTRKVEGFQERMTDELSESNCYDQENPKRKHRYAYTEYVAQ